MNKDAALCAALCLLLAASVTTAEENVLTKSSIGLSAKDKIEKPMKDLKASLDSGKQIRIKGNCDERDKFALSERRVNAAKKYLVELGVDAERIPTVSWGEKKQIVFGQDEQFWSQNRRADFVPAE
ncbi:MAG: OmpA family protein [Candidatus Electronema sp. VV]